MYTRCTRTSIPSWGLALSQQSGRPLTVQLDRCDSQVKLDESTLSSRTRAHTHKSACMRAHTHAHAHLCVCGIVCVYTPCVHIYHTDMSVCVYVSISLSLSLSILYLNLALRKATCVSPSQAPALVNSRTWAYAWPIGSQRNPDP